MVFETALGFVGIAWSGAGLTRLCLFQRDRTAVERRLERLGLGGDGCRQAKTTRHRRGSRH